MFSSHCVRACARFSWAPALCAALPMLLVAQSVQAQTLTLAEVLDRATTSDPSVVANAARLQAANAAIMQADVRPRDVAGFELEDFAGTGAYSPVGNSQATAWYERTWERGGKRDARIGLAQAGVEATSSRNRLRSLDLLALVQETWVNALAAEALIPITENRLVAAQQVEGEVTRRVGRALDPLFAGERARTAVAEARSAVDRARINARIARTTLASFWGGTAEFELDPAPFAIINIETVESAELPDIALLKAEREVAGAQMRLSETGNAGDPTGRVGLRHFGQGNDLAFMVGASIPLGNRAANRGNIARAQAEAQVVDAEISVLRVQLDREIARLNAERTAIASEIARIDREILPSAERAVALVRSGFARGGTAFTFLEVHQAQQAVTDAQERRVELARLFHRAGARLDRLNGRHLPLLVNAENC